jgi:hypothetical protein
LDAVTPYGLQKIFRALYDKALLRYEKHSKAIFYTMLLGHHCHWTLQVGLGMLEFGF